MIVCCTYENLERTGRAFNAQFMLRHKCFLERQAYNVRSYNQKEYDQYDTPAAIYLVYQADDGSALGASRLTPTMHNCMITELWPEMVSEPDKLHSPLTWEGTRFCIEKDLDAPLRKRVCQELVYAYIELGLKLRIKRIIGVMPTFILRSVFRSSGVVFNALGPSKKIDGATVQGASMDIDLSQLKRVQLATGLRGVLAQEDFLSFRLTA